LGRRRDRGVLSVTTPDDPDYEPHRLFVPPDERPPGHVPADEIPAESADDTVLTALESFLVSEGSFVATFNFGWVCHAIAQQYADQEDLPAIQPCCVAAGAVEVARPRLTLEEEILADQLVADLHAPVSDEDDGDD